MNGPVRIAAFLLIFSMGCNESLPPPALAGRPHVTVTYYNIEGRTAAELRDSMRRQHPVGYDGYAGDATTTWNIRWTWKGYGQKECDLSTAEVTYTVDVILPHWVPPANADTALVTRWERYLQSLTFHERGHVENVLAAIPVVRDSITHANCGNAESAAQNALTALRKRDADYDAVTDHGATQGARFNAP